MKTKIWTLTVLALFIVSIVQATKRPQMSVVTVEDQKAVVAFECSFAAPLELTVTNSRGNIVYYKKTDSLQKELISSFSLDKFRKGLYQVSLVYGTRSIHRNLQIGENEIKVGPAEVLYEPYFCLKDGKLDISFFNIANKNVYLTIKKDGKVVDELRLGKDLTIHKRFNLTHLRKGNYKVVLTDWFGDHQHEVQI